MLGVGEAAGPGDVAKPVRGRGGQHPGVLEAQRPQVGGHGAVGVFGEVTLEPTGAEADRRGRLRQADAFREVPVEEGDDALDDRIVRVDALGRGAFLDGGRENLQRALRRAAAA